MSNERIDKIAQPILPIPSNEYQRVYFDSVLSVLRLFFLQLTQRFNDLVGDSGARHLHAPYGAFSSSVTQTAASTTVAYPVTFDTDGAVNDVSVISTSRLTPVFSGVYALQATLQFVNTAGAVATGRAWVVVDGVAVDDSLVSVVVPANGEVPVSLSAVVALQGAGYVEVHFAVSATTLQLQAKAAAVSPTRPASPSAAATLRLLSSL